MSRLSEREIQHLDVEWVELIQTARDIGLSREEVWSYFQDKD